MGGKHAKYVKSEKDIVESAIRKTQDINHFKEAIQGVSYEELLKMNFEPLNWNIIHLICWYGRADVLRDLQAALNIPKDVLNFPDKNKEPPIALACVMDNEEVFKVMSQNNNVLLNDFDRRTYREYLDLVELCAIHDSLNVMRELYSIFADELDDEEIIKYLKDVCTKYGSESIMKFLEERNIESIDMNKFDEESMNDIASIRNHDQSFSMIKHIKE